MISFSFVNENAFLYNTFILLMAFFSFCFLLRTGFHLSGVVTVKSQSNTLPQPGYPLEPEKRYRVSITFDRYCLLNYIHNFFVACFYFSLRNCFSFFCDYLLCGHKNRKPLCTCIFIMSTKSVSK